MNQLAGIYTQLYKEHGPQGWWPLLELGDVSHKPVDKHYGGYHPGDYSYPKTDTQRFEICVGAILTQNTAWNNVVKALVNLKEAGGLTPGNIRKMPLASLCAAIKPAGYYNMKAKKLLLFEKFYLGLKGRVPTRQELLDVWGIGRETADSMLLYAFNTPLFVVDAYTRRIFSNLKMIDRESDYDAIRMLFEKCLPKDAALYQEYHALIVEHAKRYYKGKSECVQCPLRRFANNKL